MKIAVASVDGAHVAATLTQARCLLVFQIIENSVEMLECRPEGAALRDGGPLVSLLPVTSGKGVDDAPLAAAVAASSTGNVADEEIPGDLLRPMLDCQIVIAGSFPAAQERELRRLGLLALPALPGEIAETAVRFVVSGTPPEEGEACGQCPSRQARPRIVIAPSLIKG